jgi:hypothetical protein
VRQSSARGAAHFSPNRHTARVKITAWWLGHPERETTRTWNKAPAAPLPGLFLLIPEFRQFPKRAREQQIARLFMAALEFRNPVVTSAIPEDADTASKTGPKFYDSIGGVE